MFLNSMWVMVASCHDPIPGVMTGAREWELLYPEPVASLKIKISNATHS